jgi:acyl-CoA reductase-like NAD-dependent aldehyde dehydrogenase
MKKEEIVKQLEATKALSSQVDIDKVIALINQIEPETKSGLTFEDTQNILDKIERALDRNSDHLVNKDTAEFEINYGNTVELDRVDVDINEIMDHVKDAIDEFVIIEEDKEIEDDDDTERILLSDINKGLGLESGGNPYVEI